MRVTQKYVSFQTPEDVSPLGCYYSPRVRKHFLYDLTPVNFTEPGFMHNTVYLNALCEHQKEFSFCCCSVGIQ